MMIKQSIYYIQLQYGELVPYGFNQMLANATECTVHLLEQQFPNLLCCNPIWPPISNSLAFLIYLSPFWGKKAATHKKGSRSTVLGTIAFVGRRQNNRPFKYKCTCTCTNEQVAISAGWFINDPL